MSNPYSQQPPYGQQPQPGSHHPDQSPYGQRSHQADDQHSGPPAPAAKRPWYTKKRFLIPGVALAAIIVIALATSPTDEEPEAGGANADPEQTVEATEPAEVEAEADLEGEDDTEGEREVDPEPEQDETPEPETETVEEVTPPEGSRYEGGGSSVIMLEEDMDEVWIADISYTGTGNFSVWAVDSNGQQRELLVNDVDAYSGVVGVNLTDDSIVALDVSASGPWTIDTVHLADSPRWDVEGTYEASGDGLLILEPAPEGFQTVTIEHAGRGGNFTVWAYADGAFGPSLMVNEIGEYSGQDLLPNDTFLLEVGAEGVWTITAD